MPATSTHPHDHSHPAKKPPTPPCPPPARPANAASPPSKTGTSCTASAPAPTASAHWPRPCSPSNTALANEVGKGSLGAKSFFGGEFVMFRYDKPEHPAL